jgi:hypothetical protein
MPEDILAYDGKLYVSMNMNPDWTSGNTVEELALENGEWSIINSFEVVTGPGRMLIHNDDLYVASTYYDDAWQSYAGTSRINLTTGDILAVDYGQSYSYGGDLATIGDDVYRSTSTGASILSDSLTLMSEGTIDGMTGVYSFATIDSSLYFGLTDYVAPDDVRVYTVDGDSIANYTVGALPGTILSYEPIASVVYSATLPTEFTLEGNYPNPFNPSTKINFSVENTTQLSAQIIDITGRIVMSYPAQSYNAGHHSIIWNGMTSNKNPASSGIYFMMLSSPKESSIQRMTLLR